MKIHYNNLWNILAQQKMNKTDLMKQTNLSPNTLSKLSKNEPVSSDILIKLAAYFELQISDIILIEYDDYE